MTEWVTWFVRQVQVACEEASATIEVTLVKARFWMDRGNEDLTERQRKVMNLLLDAGPDGFEGGMSTRKYESIAATSWATASRELIELEAKSLLVQAGAGRSTRYDVTCPAGAPSSGPDQNVRSRARRGNSPRAGRSHVKRTNTGTRERHDLKHPTSRQVSGLRRKSYRIDTGHGTESRTECKRRCRHSKRC